jgi:Na+-transporting methylmalonyl-CoA/oxaloacetate decarboxylase beta subunit
MTDTEIYAELGNPKKAAAELNDQMREYAYRKSPWRFLFIALAAWGGWQMMERIIALVSYYLFCKSQPSHSSVGIIGGADGPTAIFLTGKMMRIPYVCTIIAAFLTFSGTGLVLLFTRKPKN